jgi:hypothetical protein
MAELITCVRFEIRDALPGTPILGVPVHNEDGDRIGQVVAVPTRLIDDPTSIPVQDMRTK